MREHIALFCADTQPGELRALRELALVWMDRLSAFRPHLCGAVWHGTATRHSDMYMQLYCDDPKSAEWALLDHRVEYHPGTASDAQGQPVEALTLRLRCEPLGQWVLLHLLVLDHDALRGALKPDARDAARAGMPTASGRCWWRMTTRSHRHEPAAVDDRGGGRCGGRRCGGWPGGGCSRAFSDGGRERFLGQRVSRRAGVTGSA